MIIVSLIGLKKCGKTTTAEALIREFRGRGYRVGGLKFMPHGSFSLDQEGKDTWRHRTAGADFVISLSRNELVFIQPRRGWGGEGSDPGPHGGPPGPAPPAPGTELDEVLTLVPAGTDILICEGLTQDDPRILRVVLAREPGLLRETFEVRGMDAGTGKGMRTGTGVWIGAAMDIGIGTGTGGSIGPEAEQPTAAPLADRNPEDGTRVSGPRAEIIALAGIMANRIRRHPDIPDLPVFNCTTSDGVSGLADLIEERSQGSILQGFPVSENH